MRISVSDKGSDMINKGVHKELLGNHPERIIQWTHECLVGKVTTNVDGEKKVVWTTYPVKDWPDKQKK